MFGFIPGDWVFFFDVHRLRTTAKSCQGGRGFREGGEGPTGDRTCFFFSPMTTCKGLLSNAVQTSSRQVEEPCVEAGGTPSLREAQSTECSAEQGHDLICAYSTSVVVLRGVRPPVCVLRTE